MSQFEIMVFDGVSASRVKEALERVASRTTAVTVTAWKPVGRHAELRLQRNLAPSRSAGHVPTALAMVRHLRREKYHYTSIFIDVDGSPPPELTAVAVPDFLRDDGEEAGTRTVEFYVTNDMNTLRATYRKMQRLFRHSTDIRIVFKWRKRRVVQQTATVFLLFNCDDPCLKTIQVARKLLQRGLRHLHVQMAVDDTS